MFSRHFFVTLDVYPLSAFWFEYLFLCLGKALQNELELCAICHPAHSLPNHGLGPVKHIESHIFIETVYAITVSFFQSTACDKAHFRMMYWGKYPALSDLKIELTVDERNLETIVKPIRQLYISTCSQLEMCLLNLLISVDFTKC